MPVKARSGSRRRKDMGYANSVFSDGGRDTMPLEVFP